MKLKRRRNGWCFLALVQMTSAMGAEDTPLQLKLTKDKVKSVYASDRGATQQSDSTAKAIITTLPSNEKIQVSTSKQQVTFKASLRKKGLVWVEESGIARIVPIKDASIAKQELKQISASSWCDTTSSGTVSSNFPEPTSVVDITRANVLWKGITLIAPEAAQGKVRIVLDGKVTSARACRLWLAALSQIGWALLHDGSYAVLLPKAQQKTWTWPTRETESSGAAQPPVAFDFPELTDVRLLVAEYSKQTGQKLLYASDSAVRVRIMAPKPIPSQELSFVFQSALASVGLHLEGDFVR